MDFIENREFFSLVMVHEFQFTQREYAMITLPQETFTQRETNHAVRDQ